jgi:hypothetical protein
MMVALKTKREPIGDVEVDSKEPVVAPIGAPLSAVKGTSTSKAKSRRREDPNGSVRTTPLGGRSRGLGDVAEVLEAFKVAFALADSSLGSYIAQPAANAMARRAIDRYGLPRVLAAVSIAPRHKWISAEFLAKRALPSLSIILSEKVLSQLVAEVSER